MPQAGTNHHGPRISPRRHGERERFFRSVKLPASLNFAFPAKAGIQGCRLAVSLAPRVRGEDDYFIGGDLLFFLFLRTSVVRSAAAV
jgi:hypothetical protein